VGFCFAFQVLVLMRKLCKNFLLVLTAAYRVGNFRPKIFSSEGGIDGTIGFFWLFRKTGISGNFFGNIP
jgi:hypothetical protein